MTTLALGRRLIAGWRVWRQYDRADARTPLGVDHHLPSPTELSNPRQVLEFENKPGRVAVVGKNPPG